MSSTIPSDDNNTNSDVGVVDTTPFLSDDSNSRRPRLSRRTASLSGAARFLRRASSRRMMREPSVRVREAAAEQIEERQSDWAYSKPIVILDLIWNFAFVLVSLYVLFVSRFESPSMPLRVWIVGYGFQCVVHMVCVCLEYMRRWESPRRIGGGWSSGNSSGSDVMDSGDYISQTQNSREEISVAKHLESANTMFSFIWWIIGFYWVSAGGVNLTQDSPQLYWLCITFLAFDVFFVVICVAVACVIGIAVCCCLPCIIAILYAVADQEGATKEDIERLPKYKFRLIGDFEKQNGEIQESFGGIMTECEVDSPMEHVLPQEDAVCLVDLYLINDHVFVW
ncbi:hypothetical protein LIER_30736 [Lithospermum erythrorhizon]|uniref:RING-type E3 ubiquitin transferase n=1 Tax=Lithospermum erythrorhizon TaxID=34254 RepID=A0AAV3RSQ2_LITER